MPVRGTSPISTISGNSPTSREDRARADSCIGGALKDQSKIHNHTKEYIQAESSAQLEAGLLRTPHDIC
jgi:hypothetical protein